jgi:cell wall-associated NlpC family hydrolase
MAMCGRKGVYGLSVLVILIVILAIWRLLTMHEANPMTIEQKLSQINQDPAYYIDPKQASLSITAAQQEQLAAVFKKLWFSPWNNDDFSNISTAATLSKLNYEMQYFLANPGWQFTSLVFPADDIKKLLTNVDLTGYPAINRPGIIVHVTQVRVLPTLLPQYKDPALAGQGYPFDNWINSYLYPGAPIRILQSSQDRLWYLIKTASFHGWTPSKDIAFVSADFINNWKKAAVFVTPMRDGAPLFNQNNFTISDMQKGMIYPALAAQGSRTPILMPMLGADGEAQIITLLADSNEVQPFPIPATPQNIAAVGKSFINGQYGWGNLYQLRDCSATTQDILAHFALWLPRNSGQQGRMGKVISLAGMDRDAKIKTIAQQAAPFFTIIHFPGHIGLYLGMHNGQPYMLQDVWGMHTQDLMGRDGRAIFGRTIITPLTFGPFSNVKKLQIDLADSFSVLTPDSYQNEAAIVENVWNK